MVRGGHALDVTKGTRVLEMDVGGVMDHVEAGIVRVAVAQSEFSVRDVVIDERLDEVDLE
jgi:hypothetical protein